MTLLEFAAVVIAATGPYFGKLLSVWVPEELGSARKYRIGLLSLVIFSVLISLVLFVQTAEKVYVVTSLGLIFLLGIILGITYLSSWKNVTLSAVIIFLCSILLKSAFF
jgi:hypothetical protein